MLAETLASFTVDSNLLNGALIAAIITASIALARLWSEKKVKGASAANHISSGFERLVSRLQEQAERDKVEIMELKLRLHQADELVGELQVANDALRDITE